ncbi:MAG: flagellar biosynthetic protein FliR [Treponema sp.]|nr:flagellar biosynthetic protein FliR [Treponema sp.]
MIENQMINDILSYAPIFLLISVRAFAMMQTAPLLNSETIPQIVRLALSGFAAYAAFSVALIREWVIPPFGLEFVFIVIGEGLIGIIIGFFMAIVFAAFSTAGQFFSLQMGFGASETFDPLSQIENPLLGQYLNIVGMLIFVTIDGFRELFLGGFLRSLQTINVFSLIHGRETIVSMMMMGLSRLFFDAIIISLPILGTLFLTSLSTGLISKAAPQINILSEGFPISITVAFLIIYTAMPFMTEMFSRVIISGFEGLRTLYIEIGQRVSLGSPGGLLGVFV